MRADCVKREFLKQFLNKISNFPSWVKEIIYKKLSEEFDNKENPAYIFAAYKPILTYKGRCELEFKNQGLTPISIIYCKELILIVAFLKSH